MTLITLLLLGMCVEAAREAFWPKSFAARHYPRMMNLRELPWWAERRTVRERLEHRKRFHIDLVAMMAKRKKR